MWRSDGGGQSQSQRHRPQVSPGPQASSGQLQQHDGDAVRIDVLAVDETALRRQFRTEKSTFFSTSALRGKIVVDKRARLGRALNLPPLFLPVRQFGSAFKDIPYYLVDVSDL
ncbi:hypothetical protein CGMCC3_g10096 [Colletotrichum fructicola]|nr:uncharacterized protein CGMCC3_g10096 [Colletotrichum fructicola]KAE9573696.1 hypothetical protein CGMCC3_g10096 [Colletotrichum fructicola]